MFFAISKTMSNIKFYGFSIFMLSICLSYALENSTNSFKCPYSGEYIIKEYGNWLNFSLPQENMTIPANTNCSWSVLNPSKYFLKISARPLVNNTAILDIELADTNDTITRMPTNALSRIETNVNQINFTLNAINKMTNLTYRVTIYSNTDEEIDAQPASLYFLFYILIGVFISVILFVIAVKWCSLLCVFYCFTSQNDPDRLRKRNNKIIENVLKFCPEISYDDKENTYKQPSCCICLCTFKPYKIRILECEHVFHGECINQYLKSKIDSDEIKCPVCNLKLTGHKKSKAHQ